VLRRSIAALGCSLERLDRVPFVPEAVVAELAWDGMAIEVFCQPLPVSEQAAFRHLVIEGQLLVLGGEVLRAQVRELKRAGVKTEVAFARVLGLAGDPYAALLALEGWAPDRLRRLIEAARAERVPPSIEIYEGDRAALLPLFRLADDSEPAIAGYLARGTVLVATERGRHVGHVQMIQGDAPTTWELKSIAVVESHRGSGLGQALIAMGISHVARCGARTVVLSTGAADTALLRFYQRRGFRLRRVERDFFTPAAGYPPNLHVDGIRLLDRVWLDLEL
jgi:ribosomal protein S18 acetylase RimI-like enzyme